MHPSQTQTCDACSTPLTRGSIGIGGALLCRKCAVDVESEMAALRAANKPVNALGIARRIWRSNNSPGSYLLRDIPEDLWTRAKHQAVEDGSLRNVILKALESYLA